MPDEEDSNDENLKGALDALNDALFCVIRYAKKSGLDVQKYLSIQSQIAEQPAPKIVKWTARQLGKRTGKSAESVTIKLRRRKINPIESSKGNIPALYDRDVALAVLRR